MDLDKILYAGSAVAIASLIGTCGITVKRNESAIANTKELVFALIAQDNKAVKNLTQGSEIETDKILELMREGKIKDKAFTSYVSMIKDIDSLSKMLEKLANLKNENAGENGNRIDRAIKIVYDERQVRTVSGKGKVSVIHTDPRVAKGLENFLNNNRAMV